MIISRSEFRIFTGEVHTTSNGIIFVFGVPTIGVLGLGKAQLMAELGELVFWVFYLGKVTVDFKVNGHLTARGLC